MKRNHIMITSSVILLFVTYFSIILPFVTCFFYYFTLCHMFFCPIHTPPAVAPFGVPFPLSHLAQYQQEHQLFSRGPERQVILQLGLCWTKLCCWDPRQVNTQHWLDPRHHYQWTRKRVLPRKNTININKYINSVYYKFYLDSCTACFGRSLFSNWFSDTV